MTGYTITVGYNSGHSREDVGRELLAFIEALRSSPQTLINEVERLEPGLAGPELLAEYAASYGPESTDLTLRIDTADGLPVIRQSASGGGQSRDLKEAFRRAFCRLVMEAMHKLRMEISINVA